MNSCAQGELFSFPTPDKHTLHGFLAKPKKRTRTCIIYLHGMCGNFYKGSLIPTLRDEALRKGLAFCTINTRGHDIIASSRKQGKWVLFGTGTEHFEKCIQDIQGSLTAVRKRGFTQYILMGHSTGCQKIAFYQYKRKDRTVCALVLLAPSDDYNYNKIKGASFVKAVQNAKKLLKKGKGEIPQEQFFWSTPKRFLSVADLRYPEARLFNYRGPMKEFRQIKTPMLAVFGKEEQVDMNVSECLDILEEKTSAKNFKKLLVEGDHSFRGHERAVAKKTLAWIVDVK